LVARKPAAGTHDGFSGCELRIGGHSNIFCLRSHDPVIRSKPLAAEIHRVPADISRHHTTANAVPCFKDQDILSGHLQILRSSQP
jgi:hypothetical protein